MDALACDLPLRLPRDIVAFLNRYPGQKDERDLRANLEFYSNSRRCQPDNKLIDEIHTLWFGDYDMLESKHGFIQWLFPIREHGMNYESQPLQMHEIRAMRAESAVMERVITSYRLMLDFYGMRLVSSETGVVDRCLPPRNYAARYNHLVRSPHNYLRISRMLKCLSELGLERLSRGFVLHVLNEQSENGELDCGGILRSMDVWWANCLRDEGERGRVRALIGKVRAGDGYVYGHDVMALLGHRSRNT